MRGQDAKGRVPQPANVVHQAGPGLMAVRQADRLVGLQGSGAPGPFLIPLGRRQIVLGGRGEPIMDRVGEVDGQPPAIQTDSGDRPGR